MSANFITAATIRAELEALLQTPSDDVLWSEIMHHRNVAVYLAVQKHRRGQSLRETVRAAVMAALEECG